MATIVEMINPLTGLPEQVDKLDHTAQEIDDAVGLAPQLSNPNLLDNWYFGNPVDQRQGRVVVPNTTYYSDNTLITSAGTTGAYVTAYRYATGTESGVNYASFKLTDSDSAPTYYAAPENVVRGYTGTGYGPDRWKNQFDTGSILFENDGITLIRPESSTELGIHQKLPIITTDQIEVTLSVLFKGGASITYWGKTAFETVSKVSSDWDVLAYTYVIPAGTDLSVSYFPWIGFINSSGLTSTKFKAAKLELGTTQTLAHQDADGNWVLNEVPDYGEQLRRCQRYFVNFNPYKVGWFAMPPAVASNASQAYSAVTLPVAMRAQPVVSYGGKIALSQSADHAVTAILVSDYTFTGNSIQLRYDVGAGTLTANSLYRVQGNNDPASYIWLSADL